MRGARIARLLRLRGSAQEYKKAQDVEEHQKDISDKALLLGETEGLKHSQRTQTEIVHDDGAKIGDLPVEVLQNIFSHLDLRTLLRCQCVCKHWDVCIPGDSTQLHESLFLPSTITKPRYASRFILNFVIHCHDTKKSKGNISHVERIEFHSVSASHDEILLNPFIKDIGQYSSAKLPDLNYRYQLRQFRFIGLMDRSGKLWHPSSIKCIRDTFVTIPPLTNLQAHFSYENRGMRLAPWEGEKYIALHNETGIKFMDLFDVFEKQVAGLLKHETIRRIEMQPKHNTCSELHHLRKSLLSQASPL